MDLEALSLAAMLGIPIAALNAWIYAKSLGRSVSSSPLKELVAVAAVYILLACWRIRKTDWAGFAMAVMMAFSMIGMNLYLLLLTKNYALAFYALFIVIISILYHVALLKVFQAPYYNPGLFWFEGAPRCIPRLEASIEGRKARFTRLTDAGCFVYLEESAQDMGNAKKPLRFEMRFEGRTAVSGAEVVTRLERGGGFGLRFARDDFDSQKEIRDFIEMARSAGYVAY